MREYLLSTKRRVSSSTLVDSSTASTSMRGTMQSRTRRSAKSSRRPLDQTLEVGAVEVGHRRLLLHPAAEEPQDDVRDDGRQPDDRIEHDVEEKQQRRERPVVEVGIALDDRLGQILRHEDDDDRRDDRLEQHRPALRHGVPARQRGQRPQQRRHVERVDDQRDVVAHQNRGDILPGMPLEDLRHEIEQHALLAVDLQLEAVLAHESDLHPRKESGEEQHRKDQNEGYGHGFGRI